MTFSLRRTAVVAGLALVAVACSTAADGPEPDAAPEVSVTRPSQPDSDSGPSPDIPLPAVGSLPEGPSALDDMRAGEFPEPLVDPGAIISGGPPPDGIPAIDDPAFLNVGENLDLLPADEPVVALEIDGEARAYPVRILIWHEIVNDTVGGVPVSVTYCPLCNSAATYVR
jgi:hypothetical protein